MRQIRKPIQRVRSDLALVQLGCRFTVQRTRKGGFAPSSLTLPIRNTISDADKNRLIQLFQCDPTRGRNPHSPRSRRELAIRRAIRAFVALAEPQVHHANPHEAWNFSRAASQAESGSLPGWSRRIGNRERKLSGRRRSPLTRCACMPWPTTSPTSCAP